MGTLLEIMQYGTYSDLIKYFLDIIPIALIAIIALVLAILAYRNTKKILKKLEEK